MGRAQPVKASKPKKVQAPAAADVPTSDAAKDVSPVGLLGADKLAHSIKDAPAIIGVSKATLYRMIKDGKLKPRNVGGATVVRRIDLQALLDDAPLARNAAQ